MAASRELSIGTNRLTVTGDTVCIDNPQVWGETDLQAVLELFAQVRAQQGRLYIISQAQTPAKLPNTARRLMGKWYATHSIDLLVIVGTGPATRALVEMLFGAMRLLSKRAPPAVCFCSQLAEAVALVEAERARNQSVSSKRPPA
jgi:hypothetical protein